MLTYSSKGLGVRLAVWSKVSRTTGIRFLVFYILGARIILQWKLNCTDVANTHWSTFGIASKSKQEHALSCPDCWQASEHFSILIHAVSCIANGKSLYWIRSQKYLENTYKYHLGMSKHMMATSAAACSANFLLFALHRDKKNLSKLHRIAFAHQKLLEYLLSPTLTIDLNTLDFSLFVYRRFDNVMKL